MNPQPSVFISYSHESPAHKNWVAMLAARLQTKEFPVIYDEQDGLGGDDIFLMMESFVKKADCLLAILTPEYHKRAQKRTRGTGHEFALFLEEIYNEDSQKLFIPVLRSGTHMESTPQALMRIKYIDMRDDASFEQRLEELVRALSGQRGSSAGNQGFFTAEPKPGERSRNKQRNTRAGFLAGGFFVGTGVASGQGLPHHPVAPDPAEKEEDIPESHEHSYEKREQRPHEADNQHGEHNSGEHDPGQTDPVPGDNHHNLPENHDPNHADGYTGTGEAPFSWEGAESLPDSDLPDSVGHDYINIPDDLPFDPEPAQDDPGFFFNIDG